MKTLKNSATGASTQLVSRVGSVQRGTPGGNSLDFRYQCSTLQHTAARCNTLLQTTTHCVTLQPIATHLLRARARARVLVHTHTRTLAHTK